MKKLRHSPRSPAQIESIGKMSQAELGQLSARYIRDELLAADCRAAAARSAAAAGGLCPPPTNRGGKFEEVPEFVELVLDDGKIKQIPHRRSWGGDAAFVDWINLTIGEETIGGFKDDPALRIGYVDGQIDEFFDGLDGLSPVTPFEVMIVLSNRLMHIFGFGITSKRPYGANFYRDSWVIGDDWGMVCHGGQRGTIMVTLNGTGCAAAKSGWEFRLKQFLESAKRARITRLDLAHDDYEGLTYSVDKADSDHTLGLFNCGGRNPDCEHRGNWKNPNGKGRTLNIGNRKNGKYCRVYEKGRQLGDVNSEWVRIEVEFKSVDRIIPFDALVNPGQYLAASYPAFVWISETQERIFTTQKVVVASVEKAVKWIRHQCGPSIGAMVDLFGADRFLEKVVREGNAAWSKIPVHYLSPDSISLDKNDSISLEMAASAVEF